MGNLKITTGLAVSNLTAGRIVYVDTDGLLKDDADITCDGTSIYAPQVEANTSSNRVASINVLGAALASNKQYLWSNTTSNWYDAQDTGLARSAAGVVKVTDGSTGYGALNVATIQADPQTTDAASQALTIMGGDAFAGAATNVTGGALNLSGGIGKRIYTIVDYTALAAATVTVTVNGSATVKTEGGGDWTAATSNNDTATSLASAIDAISGVSATASGATVRIVPDVTTYSIKLAKSAADAAMTQTVGADGGVVGNRLLHAATGNEIAYTLNYETAKATSGNDTGLLISMTDTASPGTSLLIDAQVGGTSKFSVTNAGLITAGPVSMDPTTIFAWQFDAPDSSTRTASLNQYGVVLANTKSFIWNSGATWFGGSNDTGLARSAAGVVKVTDGSTGYGRLRYECDKREFGVHKTPGTGATVTAYGGAPTHTLTGTASNVSDSTGHYVQLSGDGAAAGIDIAATECVKTEIDPVVTFIIKTGAALPTDATERIWVGLASASLAGSDSPSGIHVAAFRYAIDTDGTVFWRCVTNDGGADTGTTTVTTTAIAAATRYRLTIDATDSASITFFINGVLVATHAANLPTATQALGCTCLTVDAGAGTQEILISKIHYETT